MHLTTDHLISPLPATGPATSPVPLMDVTAQNARVRDAAVAGIAQVIDAGSFVLGAEVECFEEEYAAFCGVQHCVGVGNGTDALELGLRAAGAGPGTEVIVPANTFVATAEAVVRTGADLVLVDCDDDFLLDPERAAAAVTPRTRAVIGVDLYGQVARFEALREAVGDDVALVEDAAQAQGATRHGRFAGGFGVVSATSFYPGKNLGAMGDAGAVTTDDADIAARVRALRNHGGTRRYQHTYVGTNSRLDGFQAVVLSLKLRHLREWNQERARAAEDYDHLLTGVETVTRPRVLEGNRHVWHLYVVRVADRDRVLPGLHAAGVGAGVHYPTPVHLLPAFSHLGLGRGSFPVAERLADEILSLPMYPGLGPDQVERVVTALAHLTSGVSSR
jgi:dTDP-4-amino-4,6-dideoxygalactose transaminase